MTRISKSRLRDNQLEEITEHFFYLISSLSKSTEIENFLNNFLTKEEKIMLTKRLVLFMMIKRNYPPHIIQNALHVSYETVRSYNDKLPMKDSLFQAIIEKLVRREKSKELWRKVDKLLKPIDLFLRAKTDMKARAKFASGDWS